MMFAYKAESKRIKTLLVGLMVGLGTTACATSAVNVQKQAAPITFKIDGEGGGQYAALKRDMPLANPGLSPITRPLSSAPRQSYSSPQTAAPVRPAPLITPRIPEIQFNAQSVDKELYAHQRVGKPYKISGKRYTPKHQPNYDKTGLASWYGPKFNGKPTASGEIFDKSDMTAAHKTLPLNSLVHVTNLENGRTLIVRVNDRGPFVDDRIIDLSEGAASALGTIQNGLAKVRVRYAGPADPSAARNTYKAPTMPSLPAPRLSTPQPQAEAAPQIAQRPQVTIPQAMTPPRSAQPIELPQSDYQPLRSLGGQPSYTPPQATPQPERVSEIQTPQPLYEAPQTPAPLYNAPVMPFVPAPVSPDRLAPVKPPRPEQGGNVTLTIKGPIHMAKQGENDPAPTWIPAVNRVNKTQ